ncbi:multicomponent Na+:H+ antiporter subunit E [Alkalibacillus flavidus]|uniref:Multicomponent Na+:H+ antiporter subunit E n=1 Tax=Alkalibacillus flavidus TaxID=546021 RepID=A0ABV2KSC4_9BACI
MAVQIVVNLLIAITWMFLSETYDFVSFFVGYVIGIGLLFLLRRFLTDKYYMVRVFSVIKLILIFIKELILSSIEIVKHAYKPSINVEPGIFALPIDLTSDKEITLLTSLISLTPGTLSVSVSYDCKHVYIHAMDLPDVEASINDIKQTFESAIMEVTR